MMHLCTSSPFDQNKILSDDRMPPLLLKLQAAAIVPITIGTIVAGTIVLAAAGAIQAFSGRKEPLSQSKAQPGRRKDEQSRLHICSNIDFSCAKAFTPFPEVARNGAVGGIANHQRKNKIHAHLRRLHQKTLK
jgi:hypothetical protein